MTSHDLQRLMRRDVAIREILTRRGYLKRWTGHVVHKKPCKRDVRESLVHLLLIRVIRMNRYFKPPSLFRWGSYAVKRGCGLRCLSGELNNSAAASKFLAKLTKHYRVIASAYRSRRHDDQCISRAQLFELTSSNT